MWFKKKKDKKVSFYIVTHENEPNRFLTITTTVQDAIEYASQSLKWDHIDHFQRWCEVHELDFKEKKSWEQYLGTCISTEESNAYKIKKIKYNYSFVAAMLRMLAVCAPIGCSYETPNECKYFEDKINKEERKTKIINELKTQLLKFKDIVDLTDVSKTLNTLDKIDMGESDG